MPPRPHDPFNDAPRRPISRATSHLHDTYSSGGHALRANAAARSLFAPALSRRPTTTGPSSTHLNELVLEDSDDAGDRTSRRAAAAGRATRTRRARAATETTIEPDEENRPEPLRDMVVRDEKGNYLHEVPALGEHTNGAEDEGMIFSLSSTRLPLTPRRHRRRTTFDSSRARVLGIWGCRWWWKEQQEMG